MNRYLRKVCVGMWLSMSLAGAANAATECGHDAVPVGTACLDRYEASVWRVPEPLTTNASLVMKIQRGDATAFDLAASGATQLGVAADDYAPCADDGRGCAGEIFAVSLPSEVPSSHITWFQAQEACANAAKRLPTSAEWQVGANGTPDDVAACNSAGNGVAVTGSLEPCVSSRGAFDMAGNVDEWVGDWVPLSTGCATWGSLSDDRMCLFGASAALGGPGALLRGGSFLDGTRAGPLAVVGGRRPSSSSNFTGFRCARSVASLLPAEVDGSVRISRNGANAVITWNAADDALTSQVLRGLVSELPVGSHSADERCLVEDAEAHVLTDADMPPRGDGFWYLVRGRNEFGTGSYGFEGSRGVPAAPRISATCP